MTDPIPWLPPPADGTDATDDPWAEVDLPEVALSDEQLGFLASFAEQPSVPRLRNLGDLVFDAEEDAFEAEPEAD